MHISKIPPEILTSIALSFSEKDLPQCSLVCKKWREVFYVEPRGTVKIYDSVLGAMLYRFFKEKHLIYRQHVQAITGFEECPVSINNLLILQKLFPNTRNLDITISHPNTRNTDTKWSVRKLLKNLGIQFDQSVDSSLKKPYYVILSRFSCLTTLDLMFSGSYTSRVGDFEAIHNYLPHLESFSHRVELASITEEEMKCINETVPVNNLSKISIAMDTQDLRWLYYFAVKYPNVREMTLEAMGIRNFLEDCNTAVAKSKISSLPHVFSSLKKLTLENSPHTSSFLLAFYQCFYNGTLSIKEFLYKFYISCKERAIENATAEFMRVCSRTIESITLSEIDYMEQPNPFDSTHLFTDCPRLTNLEFYNCGSCLQFNTILDCCPSLKKLELYTGGAYIDSRAIQSFHPHGLRIIRLDQATIDPDTMKYISARCLSLSHVYFHKLMVIGTISEDTGNLLIDMSNLRLKKLIISTCQAVSSND
ncbi:hypothetical protein J3Q64DRAFT_1862494 [Phycomyces blakesleeanus]|uniref:F-box domain-containing protein n=1 Tax=Phycomyces blakesleeanus TaxID=4837 RepID=A0ABR3AZ72_PHYBL